MNTYECLQDEACEDGIDVIDYTFHSNRIKGLYCDGVVAIREDMTIPEKTCALAEEIGHHGTSYGNIIDMDSVQNPVNKNASSKISRIQSPDWSYWSDQSL